MLELAGMGERERTASLRRVFNRDIRDNHNFCFRGKPILPTPKKNDEIDMERLFDHLTTREVDKEKHHREYDRKRSERLHWINYHVKQSKHDNMLHFSVAEPQGNRTYIYDTDEKYVIVLEPLRDGKSYYLLTAYPLEGKDLKRNKIMNKYYKHRLPDIL
ncbi:MAG: hypothetical protein LUC33_06295 [Prevotellaceae bacterium]|nr:hypothetical protein [Prevotellaceae bacterium]